MTGCYGQHKSLRDDEKDTAKVQGRDLYFSCNVEHDSPIWIRNQLFNIELFVNLIIKFY